MSATGQAAPEAERPPGAADAADAALAIFAQDAETGRLTPELLQRAFDSLIAPYPEAPVSAHAPEGVMVSMPQSIAEVENGARPESIDGGRPGRLASTRRPRRKDGGKRCSYVLCGSPA